MTAGLQVFDANGNLTLDITDRLTRVIGSFTVAAGAAAGSITVAQFSTGTPWVFPLIYSINGDNTDPAFSISGTTLSWTANTAALIDVFVIYGVY